MQVSARWSLVFFELFLKIQRQYVRTRTFIAYFGMYAYVHCYLTRTFVAYFYVSTSSFPYMTMTMKISKRSIEDQELFHHQHTDQIWFHHDDDSSGGKNAFLLFSSFISVKSETAHPRNYTVRSFIFVSNTVRSLLILNAYIKKVRYSP